MTEQYENQRKQGEIFWFIFDMLNISDSDYYRRNLPHLQPAGAEYFVTFRLKGSLPKRVIKQLKKEQAKLSNNTINHRDLLNLQRLKQKKIFKRYEKILDSNSVGPAWLQNNEIADIVSEAIFFRDERNYILYAFSIMSNHVHLVFKLLQNENNADKFAVTKILGALKSYTALKCNRHLGRSGAFWQNESYDHVIRNSNELSRIIRYVLNNPVKAGLVKKWNDWEYSYCKPTYSNEFL